MTRKEDITAIRTAMAKSYFPGGSFDSLRETCTSHSTTSHFRSIDHVHKNWPTLFSSSYTQRIFVYLIKNVYQKPKWVRQLFQNTWFNVWLLRLPSGTHRFFLFDSLKNNFSATMGCLCIWSKMYIKRLATFCRIPGRLTSFELLWS